MKLSYYQKSGFKSVFLEFGPEKDPNWSDLSLILSEIWSVFGLILAILGPEYKVEALLWLTQLFQDGLRLCKFESWSTQEVQ